MTSMMGWTFPATFVMVILLDQTVTLLDAVEKYQKSPLTTYDVSGHLDQSVTLRCQLQTEAHSRGWFLIKWDRLEPDGTTLPMASLPARKKDGVLIILISTAALLTVCGGNSTVGDQSDDNFSVCTIPEWSPNIPPTLQARVHPTITIQQGHVEFNLVISNLTCSDEGEYRCSAIVVIGVIISTAELGIYAGPQTPHIKHLFVSTSETTKIEATCTADVGFPPRMLVWYLKRIDSTHFTPVDKQPDVVKESDGCHTVSTRSIEVILNPETRGTHYRCGYPGYIEKEGMFDQLVLQMETEGVKDIRSDGKMAAMCDFQSCDVSATIRGQSTEHTNNNRASSTAVTVDAFWTCTAVLLFHRHITISSFL